MQSKKKKAKNRKTKKPRSQKARVRTKQIVKSITSPGKEEKSSLGVGMKTPDGNGQALQESEKEYRALIEQSLQGIVVIQDFRILFANAAIAEICGYTVKELLSFSPEQLRSMIHPEDQALVWGRFRDRLAGKPLSPQYEYRIKRKDGTVAWLETFSRRIEYQGKFAIQAAMIDITERKKTQERLLESEKKYRTLVESAQEGIGITDPDENILFVNQAFTNMLGYQKEKLLGLNLKKISDKEGLTGFRRETKKRQNGESSRYEAKLYTRTGESRYFSISATPLFDKQGTFTGTMGLLLDITERRQAEELIKQQKEFLNNIIESLTYPFYVIDANDYTIKMANSAIRLGNLSESSTCYALTHKSNKPCKGKEHPCPLEEVKKTKKPVIVEHIHNDKEGNVRNVEVHAYPIFNNKGDVVQIIEYYLDITERQRAEQALRESEERFHRVAQTASDAIITVDSPGNIVFWNQAAEAMFGYSSDEAVGKPLTMIMPERFHKAYKKRVERAVSTGEAKIIGRTVEMDGLRKDGSEFPLELSIATWKTGEETFFTGIIRDIAERKRTEEKIQRLNESLRSQAMELAAANKELEAFSYSVSHDLRAPLRSIEGFSRALLEDYANKLDEPGKDYLKRVRVATQHMRQLIDNLLKLSLMIRTEMRREETDLSELVRAITAELQKTQPERQVEFVIQKGVFAYGDPRLLREVLENLLGNAWKFTGKNSQAKIKFGVIEQDEQTVYFVRDDGVGFDMSYADKLFIPFQRLHSTAEFSGNGIGLAIASRIINRHGGRIWADGEVEKGATFYFTLK